MKLQSMILIGVMMILLSACVVPQSAQPAEQSVGEETMDDVHAQAHTTDVPEQLGEVNFPVSCTPEAQADFNQGMARLHSFWFAPAIEAFNTAAERDPSCAMAHWGVAMSLLGIPWSPAPPQAVVDGWTAVEKAAAIGAQTPREQAYINAITAFYKDADTVDRPTRALAYEQAMAQLAQDHADDPEAQIFYALALNITALPTDKSYANQLKAAEILEAIFVAQPNHPGVTHYLIHSYDYPTLAAQGLDAALRYAEIAPASPHALHMPSHTFTRLGYWQESIDSNAASAQAAKDGLSALHPPNTGFVDALHAMDYMMYGYLQLSHDGAAKALLDEIAGLEGVDTQNLGSAYALAAIPARYVLERGQWDEAAMLALHPQEFAWERFPQAEAVMVFARGLGAAHTGDVTAARQELERLVLLREAMLATNQGYWAEQAEIQSLEVAAWIALAEGDEQEALALMHEAAALEATTEKHPVTPGPIVPAYELLGEMLLEFNQPQEALAAFEKSHQIEPNRFRGFYGAARAAELIGDREKARSYYEQVVSLAETASGGRAEVAAAIAFLAQ